MTKGNKQNFQRKRKGHDATKQEKQERSPSISKTEVTLCFGSYLC